MLANSAPPEGKTPDPMTGPALARPVRLWTPEGFRDDEWTHADDADALMGEGRFILPARAVVALDPELRRSSAKRLGVHLLPGEPLDGIAGLLGDLSLVALAFPAFNDGRSFSKAALLRNRHAFEGAVRATGQVLIDQLPHMLRLGFDEFEVSNPVLLARLQRGKTGGIPFHYQPAAIPALLPGKFSWRRTRLP
jgi:uncharacterized protein (DUF934 family)